ncbi:hypothetical protein GCM10027046_05470 [Uliginosibacterium flavum]|uniref:SoxR reducing system RseC family protein n=1 Tax=Uliginosibacterium flavum TaxID=1396831 RepID=A0ABV2TIZ3_9RHOO
MIERQAKIIAIHADSIQLAVQPEAACSACGARKACQGDSAANVFSLPLQPGLSVGEHVALQMESSTITRSALLAYLLPAISLILGAQIGQSLGHTDGSAMIGSALGLATGLLAARLLAGIFSDAELQPSIHACLQTPSFKTGSTAP